MVIINRNNQWYNSKTLNDSTLVSGIRITDSAQTLGYVFGRRNMKKAVMLDLE